VAHRTRSSRSAREQNHRALSQNFLTDRRAIDQVVRAAGVAPGDLVIEVGAGEGALTWPLARAGAEVLAYELDPRLAAALAARSRADARIRCVRGDFLAARPPGRPFAVVGNIPYAATARIVDWCLRAPRLSAATLVTQLEYARKRTGGYGRWSQLTVQTWPAFDWHSLGRIPRSAFRPVPRVDAGIVRLRRRDAPLLPPRVLREYRAFVGLGFGGVGGSLGASLRREYPARRVAAAFRAAGLNPATVVGYVHPAQWVDLFAALHLDAGARSG